MADVGESPTDEVYAELRPLMFSIAYRMLSSVSDAEDVVQEAFLRYHRAVSDDTEGGEPIRSPKAFLSSVTTRLCIDQLRSARARRETYVGQWLPEPLLTSSGTPEPLPPTDPAEHAQLADTLSMAFLLVLERLSPKERAAFLLHDVFAYGYDEVADVVGASEAAARQLVSRARRHVNDERPRFEPSREQRQALATRLVDAMSGGDLDGLVSLLAADVVVSGDSGGMSPSWPRPIVGRGNVARLLVALGAQLRDLGALAEVAEVNGQPGAVVRDADGLLVNVFAFDVADGVVQAIRSVINREKLAHLGPLADVQGLRERLRGMSGR
jgi:RNA polymerase sigma-70 factor (ECF subfamily)